METVHSCWEEDVGQHTIIMVTSTLKSIINAILIRKYCIGVPALDSTDYILGCVNLIVHLCSQYPSKE